MDLRAEGRKRIIVRSVTPNVKSLKRHYQNGFRGVHPCAAFTYYAGMMLLLTLQFHPAITAGTLLVLIYTAVLFGLGRKLLKYSWVYLLVFIFAVGMNVLMNHRGTHIYAYLFDRPLTLEAAVYGMQNALMLIAVLVLFQSFSETVTTQKWLYLFSRMAPKTALTTAMSLRFVPLLLRRLRDIADAQAWRGIDVRSGSLQQRAASAVHQLRVLITWSLEEAVQTADSMLARGYGTTRRSSFQRYRLSSRDIVMVLLLLGAVAVSLAGWLYGTGRLDVFPALDEWSLRAADGAVACVIWLYAAFPVVMEGKERWRWRSWN